MNTLYAISTDAHTHASTFNGIDFAGGVNGLFGVGERFAGGLAYHPVTLRFYAISQDPTGFSNIHDITIGGQVRRLFGLGYRFTGGLAYHPADDSFYAIASDQSGFSWIYRITLQGSVQKLFGLGYRFTGGLALDPQSGLFYAISCDATGLATLYSINLNGHVQPLFKLGLRFRGGLCYDPGKKVFYTAAADGQDFATLHSISLSGISPFSGNAQPLFGLGYGFDGAALSVSPALLDLSIQVKSPLPSEQFVTGEDVHLEASAAQVASGSKLVWTSSIDGPLGMGASLTAHGLSVGTHQITVSGYGLTTHVSVRVFADLLALCHASRRRARSRAFSPTSPSTGSTAPPPRRSGRRNGAPFDESSVHPSKTVPIAKLDTLRHQRFSQPLPFGDVLTAFDHVRKYSTTINFDLDAALNDAGGGTINANRSFSKWNNVSDPSDPPGAPVSYIHSLYLLLHENRHNEPGDPGHSTCTAWDGSGISIPGGMDQHFEPGSGYAAAALYLMWVYKYGIYDPQSVRDEAKQIAASIKIGSAPTRPAPTRSSNSCCRRSGMRREVAP